jgi:hypothetical protein
MQHPVSYAVAKTIVEDRLRKAEQSRRYAAIRQRPPPPPRVKVAAHRRAHVA